MIIYSSPGPDLSFSLRFRKMEGRRLCILIFVCVLALKAVQAFQPAFGSRSLPRSTTSWGAQTLSVSHHGKKTRSCHLQISMLPDFGTDLIAAANAWSVESLDGNDIASQAFAFSLFPYLALLYFLGDKNRMDTPDKANFGFRFLLAFVFMTIPAGIAAKVYYNDILANVDWLHGGAESLLTVTNLFIASGFRQAIQETSPRDAAEEGAVNPQIFVFAAIATAAFTFGAAPALAGLGLAPPHPEPANALSFPTWLIHVSSLVEWLASMALV
ncbi:unnamed protein product, partial [Heterosigma akashiwo]